MLRIILILVAVNIVVWSAIAIPLHFHPALISPAVLSYTLGLRHALDADHISAIDLITRRLVLSGDKPVTVGLFFSLGHSTIVIITSIVVAATSGALSNRFQGFQQVGGIIGTSVSATALVLLGAANAWILYTLVQRLKLVLHNQQPEQVSLGPKAFIFRKVFRVIDRPWKMFPLGVLFGLGFDTSSEIALLGLASVQGAQGTSIWLILIFPALFTAGMCLIDTTDGALMMAMYTSASFARDPIAILYYSIVFTAVTVLVAIVIGLVQILSLVQAVADPPGKFWGGISSVGDHFDIIGGAICGLFVISGLASVLFYKYWRRWVDSTCLKTTPSSKEPQQA